MPVVEYSMVMPIGKIEDYGPIPNIRIPDLLFTVFRPYVDTPFVLRQWCALPAR